MIQEEQFVIAHMNTLDLYKDDKSLRFITRDEAKEFLNKNLISCLHCFWFICTIKDYNQYCARWGVYYKQIKD